MFKFIKKSLKYLIIAVGITILFPTVLYLFLQLPYVQTFMVKRIADHFSDELKSSITVGKINYKFFNKLIINDLLIKDQNYDTLLYSKEVSVVIKSLNLKGNSFRLGSVILIRPEISLVKDTSGLMNISWYLDRLKKSNDTLRNAKGSFSIDKIDIRDASFSVVNRGAAASKSKINFNDLDFSRINGIIENIKSEEDTISFYIYNLSFREKSGFAIKKMSSSVLLAKQQFTLSTTYLNCDSSIINISKLTIKADSADSFRNFTEDIRLDLKLEKSLLSTSELRYFSAIPDEINESLWLSGRIYGTISELRGRNIQMSYRDYTSLDCDFDLSGLPKIDNSFIYIGVNSLSTNAKDLEKIFIPGRGNIILPEILHNAGNISFDGSFTGFTTDFVTYGKFKTKNGTIRTDISFRPEESKRYRIKGLITGSDIDLGVLTGKPELLGKLSIRANVDGFAYSFKKFEANLTGEIDSIEINNYKYRKIALNGLFTDKTWDGSINIADKNIKLDLLGMFNFKNKLPEFDFNMNLSEANLYNLNIDKQDTSARLTILLTSNFRGTNIDNLDGEIRLLNSNYTKYGNTLEMNDYSLKTYIENNKPVLSLRTDIADADIRGYYNFAAIGELVRTSLESIMPSKFPPTAKKKNLKKNNFSFEINFKNTDRINKFFRTGILLADKSYLRGSIFTDSIINISGNSASLSVMSNVIKDFTFNATLSGSELSADINSSELSLIRQTDLNGFSMSLKTKPDNFIFTTGWDNKDNDQNKGIFIARGKIEKSSPTSSNSKLFISIDSTDIITGGSRWKISGSSVAVDSSAIEFNKLYLTSKERYYMIDGKVSANPADTLYFGFKGIEITPLNYLVGNQNVNDPNRILYNFRGSASGKILLNNVYNDLLLESDLAINEFSVLNSQFGTIYIRSALNKNKKIIDIKASNNLSGVKMLDIVGFYDRDMRKLDLNATATKLPVDALNPLLKIFASGISGSASGKVNFTAQQGRIILKGALMAENTTMKIDYLQTRFKMNDTIRFDKEGIKFNNIKLTDEKGSTAVLTGTVYHKSFKDYTADLVVNIARPNECLVLNTKPKDNEMFYGTAYASGLTTIKARQGALSFDISARTGKNTKFYIPLTSGLSVSEYSFISFVSADSLNQARILKQKDSLNTSLFVSNPTIMDINFDLEVTPEAECQLIFDSRLGDVMKGRGSGDLNINLSPKGEFTIFGDYIIEEGEYLFTLGSIFNKNFTVENGGKIMFNGVMDNAELDMKAIYKLKTTLQPILGEEFTDRVDVQCQLNLTGKLFNPVVGLNIELPNADEQTKAYVRNYISTEEELSRQFLYLLVMNSFYTDPSKSNSTNTSSSSGAGTSAMAVTTTEMLSNQLSNWLSQISNDVNIGFNWRPGTKDINSQDVEVALSTQILNNKVVINGNFDYRGIGGATDNPNQLTGDFDAEVKLTEKLRLKVFNRFNNEYSGKGPYTQGIGVFFKEDFDKFSDLFHKKVKSDMKKEKEIGITEKESTKTKK
jgi:hypothetical protein